MSLLTKAPGLGVADDEGTGSNFKWLPAKNAKQAAAIWTQGNRWSFLNMAAISGTSNGGTASVDLISDFLGPMRVALLGNVSSSRDSAVKENVERFISGGGSASLTGTLLGPTITWDTSSYVLTAFVPRLSFDFPALGTPTNTSTTNLDLGLELKANIPLFSKNLGFFGNARGAYAMGGEKFYAQLGASDNKAFAYTLINAGITLPKLNMAVLFTRLLSGPSFINSYNGDGRISLVVSPK